MTPTVLTVLNIIATMLSPFMLAGVAYFFGWVGNVANKDDLDKLQDKVSEQVRDLKSDIRELRSDIRELRKHER